MSDDKSPCKCTVETHCANAIDECFFTQIVVARVVAFIKNHRALVALQELEAWFGLELTRSQLYLSPAAVDNVYTTSVPFILRMLMARLLVLSNRRSEAIVLLFSIQTACRRMTAKGTALWADRLHVSTLILAYEIAMGGDAVTALIMLREVRTRCLVPFFGASPPPFPPHAQIHQGPSRHTSGAAFVSAGFCECVRV